jgi:hypothetical protein
VAESLDATMMMQVQGADDVNVRSESCLLGLSVVPCWRCKQPTSVYCLGLAAGHERHLEDQWVSVETGALLFYVEYLNAEVALVVRELSPQYRLDYSTTINRDYWVNHCQHCGVLQEDHDLHCEPDGAFLPSTRQAVEQILAVAIREPLSAHAGGFSDELSLFASLRFVA